MSKENYENSAGSFFKKIMTILNSPFVITILGGVFIAHITSSMQHDYEDSCRRLAEKKEIIQYQRVLLQKFSDEFQIWHELFYEKTMYDLWLEKNALISNSVLYSDGRRYSEIQQRRNKTEELLLGRRSGKGYCKEICIFFNSTDVRRKSNNLYRGLENMYNSQNSMELYDHSVVVGKLFEDLAESLSVAILNPGK